MSNYKSKHTGAQVDEAVSKVLNGEVGGGADWNAQEGEPGYIENKPLNIYFKKFNEYNPELISQETNADNETTCIYRVYGGWWENCLIKYVNTCYEITTPYQWYTINPYSSGNRNTFHVKVEENWLDIRYNDYECSLQNIEDYLSISIDDARIPAELLNDAVLKTTPQTLTTSDKKQARENISAQEKLVSGVNVATINGESILSGSDIRINETIDLSDIITSRPSSTTEPIIVEIKGGSDYSYIYSLDFSNIFIKTVNEITLNRYGGSVCNEIHFSYAGRTFPTYDYDHVIVYYNAPNYLLVCEAFSDQTNGVYNCIQKVKFTLNKIN